VKRYFTTSVAVLLVVLLAVLVVPALRVRGSSMPFNVGIVKKSVVFLYYPKGESLEVGTGFLVEIPSKVEPTQGKNVWWAHPNERVDVAVIPVSAAHVEQLLQNDVHFMPVADFATKAETENYKVGIGDQIVTAGLVPALLDTERNYPAFKFGRISNIPEEPINMRCTQEDKPLLRNVWLLAGNFVGGNSGSPVYLLPPQPSAVHRVMLIGILAGSIPNVDLGQMVPSDYVFDVIQAHYPRANLYRGHTAHSIMK
jgi:hypothetical protein